MKSKESKSLLLYLINDPVQVWEEDVSALASEAQRRVEPVEIGGHIPTDSERLWLRLWLSSDFPQ